jgi:hypothetical protein
MLTWSLHFSLTATAVSCEQVFRTLQGTERRKVRPHPLRFCRAQKGHRAPGGWLTQDLHAQEDSTARRDFFFAHLYSLASSFVDSQQQSLAGPRGFEG